MNRLIPKYLTPWMPLETPWQEYADRELPYVTMLPQVKVLAKAKGKNKQIVKRDENLTDDLLAEQELKRTNFTNHLILSNNKVAPVFLNVGMAATMLPAAIASPFITAASVAGGMVGGAAGSAGGAYLGKKYDESHGTNYGQLLGAEIGGFAGGFAGGAFLPKAYVGTGTIKNWARNKILSNEFKNLSGQIPEYTIPYINYSKRVSNIDPKSSFVRIQTNNPKVIFNYTGPKHSWKEIVNNDGTVNLLNLMNIEKEVRSQIGGLSPSHRLENQTWHPTDWNTFLHSKDVINRALDAGYTPEEIFAAAMHDAGKTVAGDGHGPVGANLVKLVFPDATEELLTAIAEHMDEFPATNMGKAVKGVDIAEPNLFRKKLTSHLQGKNAVKMFKEYGGETWPEGSINGEQLMKYVPEARERYGLVGNTDITDEEIAQALYKHVKELGGNTAAVNELKEPQLLFRGDTKNYTELKSRMSPEELAQGGGTMDNSLGNLFLGELPKEGAGDAGVAKYLNTGVSVDSSNGFPAQVVFRPSQTGSGLNWQNEIWDGSKLRRGEYPGSKFMDKEYPNPEIPEDASYLYTTKGISHSYKLPARMSTNGVNNINGFVVRTPEVRDMTMEMLVLEPYLPVEYNNEFHWLTKEKPMLDPSDPEGTLGLYEGKLFNLIGPLENNRKLWADLYGELLKLAEKSRQGLLVSKPKTPLRREHYGYSYFALPNFNIKGAKHILPYDLRIPRNWNDKNIYRGFSIPLAAGYGLLKTRSDEK